MSQSIKNFIGVTVVASLLAYIIYLMSLQIDNCVNAKYNQGYIDACRDFYQGRLKMDLVEKEDGTRVWEEIDMNKEEN